MIKPFCIGLVMPAVERLVPETLFKQMLPLRVVGTIELHHTAGGYNRYVTLMRVTALY